MLRPLAPLPSFHTVCKIYAPLTECPLGVDIVEKVGIQSISTEPM
jgi:hypothetical protein